MLFNSLDFLIFFPCVVLVFLLVPARLRQVWLLICSYFFYMCWNPVYVLLILTSTLVTWLSGLLMERRETKRERRLPLLLCLAVNLGLLFVFKYLHFLLDTAGLLMGRSFRAPELLLPVGISFYTFQAMGYVIDCYRGDVETEHSLLRYALFVSFFPQLVAGPIERSGNLLRQIRALPGWSRRELLDFERIRGGLILMAWGLFMKTVIADRLAILVDTVFAHYDIHGSTALILAAVCFGIQIYCDFGSYSILAVGAARVLGFRLMENFNAPYLALSLTDFWRRWHISLSTWFRDYLYIPLGGNRRGRARKLWNLFLTMLVSGLWHGANWTFVFWGMLHGLLLVLENLLRPVVRRVRRAWEVSVTNVGFRLCRAIPVFLIVTLGWIFFRADTLTDAFSYIYRIGTQWDWWNLSGDAVFTWGLDAGEWRILMAALLLLWTVDLIRVVRGMTLDQWLAGQFAGFRILFMLCVVMMTVIFGIYGPGFDSQQFIYFQF